MSGDLRASCPMETATVQCDTVLEGALGVGSRRKGWFLTVVVAKNQRLYRQRDVTPH